MANFARTFSVQLVSLLITLLDRIVLTGLLIRQWGTEGFSDWTTVISAASTIVIFEFGFQQYVGNQLLKVGVRDLWRAFNRLLAWAAFVAVMIGVTLTVLVITAPQIIDFKNIFNLYSDQFVGVFIILCLWNIVRVARGPLLQIYRGKKEYHNYLWADNRATLIGIVLAIGAVSIGAGPIVVALIYVATTIIFSVLWAWMDIRKRFHEIKLHLRRPPKRKMIEGARSLRWYGLFFTVNNVVQNAPILIIAFLGLAGPVLVAFVVQRTLVNLIRTLTLNIAVAAGAELSVFKHRKDDRLFAAGTELLARLNSCLIGAATAGLIFFGDRIIALWTGDASLASLDILLLLLIPAILVAPAVGLQQTSILSDKVRLQAWAAGANIVLVVGGGGLLGSLYGTVGVAMALALAESVAIAFLGGRFAAREFKINYLSLFARSMLATSVVLAWGLCGAFLVNTFIGGDGALGLISQILLWAVIVVPLALFLAVPASIRGIAVTSLRNRAKGEQ